MIQSRHSARTLALQQLYSESMLKKVDEGEVDKNLFSFLTDEEKQQYDEQILMYATYLVNVVKENEKDIDAKILTYSRGRSIERISLVDLAILRLSIATLLFDKSTHPNIVIDEAVKLSKEFSNEVSYRFINGVLDAFVKSHNSASSKSSDKGDDDK